MADDNLFQGGQKEVLVLHGLLEGVQNARQIPLGFIFGVCGGLGKGGGGGLVSPCIGRKVFVKKKERSKRGVPPRATLYYYINSMIISQLHDTDGDATKK